MKAVIKRAASNVNEMALADFLFGHPAQVALLGLQFQWTADMQARAAPRMPGPVGCLPPHRRCLFRAHPCAGGAEPRGLTMPCKTRLPRRCPPARDAMRTLGRPTTTPARAGGARDGQNGQGRGHARGAQGGGAAARDGGHHAAPGPHAHPAHQPGDLHHGPHAPEGVQRRAALLFGNTAQSLWPWLATPAKPGDPACSVVQRHVSCALGRHRPGKR